jgi:hypothetical protein
VPPRGEQEPFDASRWSASRANAMLSCGVAFKLKYVDGLPEEKSGSAALFGSVVHQALEWWSPDRSQNLLHLMRNAWPHIAKMNDAHAMAEFLEAYQPLSIQAIKLEHQIREEWAARGKESKAPRRTKQFKESDVARQIGLLMGHFAPQMERLPWRFADEDQLCGLYDESLVLSKRYQHRWTVEAQLPNTFRTELKFDVPWRGFILRGYIDAIEPVTDRETGEMFLGVTDYKTYAREAPAQKDWRQKAMYAVAVRHLLATGELVIPEPWASAPLVMVVDYVRLLERDACRMDEEDEERLFSELTKLGAMVEHEIYLPAQKNQNPDFCPFPSQCCLRSCAATGGRAEKVEVEW